MTGPLYPITQNALVRVVQGTAATLTGVFVDQDGEPRTPGTVTVGVTASDGTVILAPGTTTTADSDGNPTVTLTPAQTAQLDLLTVTWTETSGATITNLIEIAGGRYFNINYARSVESVLRNTEKFPDDDIKLARIWTEVECERITGRSFVPRFRTDWSDGVNIRSSNPIPVRLSEVDIRTIRWVKVGGVNYASTFWELDSSGRLYFGKGVGLMPYQIANGPWRGDLPVLVTTGYEFGWPSPPDDLKRVMVTRMRSRLTDPNSPIPDRATTQTVDGTTYSLATPGQRGAKTGIPEVDEVYESYTRKDKTEDFVGSVRIV